MTAKPSDVDFVHLHNHTEYSLLDGASSVEAVVKLAAEFRMPALAITDHGNMFGAMKFYKEAQKAGVKPIIGAEVYVAPRSRTERKPDSDVHEASFHLTLLCRNETGYHNLMKLTTRAFLEGFYYRPRIDKELLAEHSEGLIGMSGCLRGEVNHYLRREDPERAMKAASEYQQILGPENFYLEVMRAGFAEQERIVPGIRELSSALDIPIVATNDCHYLRPDDARAHDALVCIQTGKKLSDQNRLRMSSNELYFRSPAEMAGIFADMPEAVRRTREVADRCNLLLDLEHVQFHLPHYSPPRGFSDALAYLSHLAREGLHKRYPRLTPAIEERLAYELDIIAKMGFPGYFLVVKDIVDFARSKGIPVGPGRGSAAGCLVLYCLGITDIDPLRYGLLFERFLTTERVSLPDVDVDFSDARRQEVIDYIRKRYGEDSVAQIITFGTMQARAAVRDVGRVLDIPIGDVDRIAKLIPQNMELESALKGVAELRDAVAEKPEYQEMLAIARKVEGLSRHASIHASAVVIAPQPLIELVPLYRSPGEEVCTQYDMYSLDAAGLLKMDILGLRTLTVVEEAAKLVRDKGISFDIETMPLDDTNTFKLVQRAETVGVFQLESAGMRDLARQMMPDRIEHIIALIALYRPGPMELIPQYLARKAGKEPISYEHPLLEPICSETYGIMIYQEQVMQAAQVLAGYSLGKADLLRRAMGKKNREEMAAQHDVFIEGCKKHSKITEATAERVFDLLAKFAGYGFNKSHAAGYAYLSYITAYLKANFPVEFIAATLTSELGDFKKLAKFVNEARRMGITVLGPDVNSSFVPFTIDGGNVRFGLAGVKNLGTGASEFIVKERKEHGPYESVLDFLVRTKGTVNRKAVESLIKAGAFDSFVPNRTKLLNSLEWEMNKAASEKLRFAERQFDMFGSAEERPQPVPVKFDTHELLTYEKDAFGFYFSSHPLEPYRAEYEALGFSTIAQVESMRDGDRASLGGVITARRARKDKRDREYAVITVEDFDGGIEVMVFSDVLEGCRSLLKTDNLVAVQGTVKVRAADASGRGQGVPQFWADRVLLFQDCGRFLAGLVVAIPEQELDDARLLELKGRLEEYPGNAPVYLRLLQSGGSFREMKLREQRVTLSGELVGSLRAAFGPESVKFKGEMPPCQRNGDRFRKRYQTPDSKRQTPN